MRLYPTLIQATCLILLHLLRKIDRGNSVILGQVYIKAEANVTGPTM